MRRISACVSIYIEPKEHVLKVIRVLEACMVLAYQLLAAKDPGAPYMLLGMLKILFAALWALSLLTHVWEKTRRSSKNYILCWPCGRFFFGGPTAYSQSKT